MSSIKRVMVFALSFILAVMNFVGTVPSTKAQETSIGICDIDFEGYGNEPTSVLAPTGNPSKLIVENKDFVQEGKSNASGAAAAGMFARVSTAGGQDVYESVSLSSTVKQQMLQQLNTLLPGQWKLKIDIDVDIMLGGSRGGRPDLFFRIWGQSAILGEGNKSMVVANYVHLEGADIKGDNKFSHYTLEVPIKLYLVSGASNDNNGIDDQMIAGSFTGVDFLLLHRSTSATEPMVIDWDNIKVTAVPVDVNSLSTAAEFAGSDIATKGSWINRYGSDGYILPGYKVAPNDQYQNVSKTGSDDLAVMPSYIDGYAYQAASLSDYAITVNPTNTASQPGVLEPVPPYTKRWTTWRTYTDAKVIFGVNDQRPHLFTFYMRNVTDDVKLEIMDVNNNVLDSRIFIKDQISDGMYVSYIISGPFKLHVMSMIPGMPTQASITGFFFDDNVISNVPINLNANADGRKAVLSWQNTREDTEVIIERKAENEQSFSIVTTLAGNAASYVDEDVQPGTNYSYRLRYKDNYSYSPSCSPVDVYIPAYNSTMLTLTSEEPSIDIGDEITLEAVLTADIDGQLSPLKGKNIRFVIDGEYAEYMNTDIGTAVTDENGKTTLTYRPVYSGKYTIKAVLDMDDVDHYLGTQATTELEVKNIAWQQPPALLRITDAVKPGEIINIYGEGIQGDAIEIAIEEIRGHDVPVAPSDRARRLSAVQTNEEGHFVTTVLPEDIESGAYNIWVKNNYGWSSPIQLNAPRPQWLSENTAFAGVKLKVMGRNLDGREFGAQEKTGVKLTNGSQEYRVKVGDVNPFAIEFEIPEDVPEGNYNVLISNDGHIWRELEYAEEYHQSLTITEVAPDPLNLNVAWVSEFNWDNSVDITDFGALPNDATDDTVAIQAAIDHIKTDGGGIVYIPNGNYRITGIALPAGVVLLGESKENAVLTYAYTGTDAANRNMINSKDDGAVVGRQGIACLKLTIDEQNLDQPFPDHFIWLGNGWGPQIDDENLRTAEYIFMKEIAMDYPMEKRPGRGMGITVVAKGHVMLRDSELKGYQATMISSYISGYLHVLNNRFDSTVGNLSIVGVYLTFEDNYMRRHPDTADIASQGIFTRGPSYIAGNIVENTGTPGQNDGETYCTENYRGGTKMFGKVMGANENTVTVAPKQINNNNWDIDKHTWAGWHIVITDGRGLGQDRLLIGCEGNTYTIDKPWDVVPDGTSKFVILVPTKGVTYYNNVAKNGAKGYWFYNDVIDSVMVGNSGENIEGFYVNTYHVERPSINDSRFTIGYFVRMEANELTGVSTKSNVGGIGVRVALEDGATDAYAYNVYGISIRNNSITGVIPAPAPTGETEAPDINGIYAVNSNKVQPATRNAMMGIIIENNTLTNIDRGISLGGTGYPLAPQWQKDISNPISWGIIIKGNAFNDVETEIIDPDTDGTVYYDQINEQLNTVLLNIDKIELKPKQKSNFDIRGILLDGLMTDLGHAQIVYHSSQPLVASIDGKRVLAQTEGVADIWVTVILNDAMVESNKVTVSVRS
ncbi:glycosyl hydrolase family 28-related protein [Mahella australiensis]|uniref:Fibronectin type III domain protein n=1 Tax=Mahella australiensis (strain DSM 15567 / CIP 107919 / 50-1 BON) TaxID=697281 RepID=F3ZWT5_MAHA5|nr:glycosyl hydrolase family 28-related protein [Mahella australiensis]AEE96528.1 Fibronectin type III domain protein [Mahella australiensis 50-1 BON]